jgi:hypothetical protein
MNIYLRSCYCLPSIGSGNDHRFGAKQASVIRRLLSNRLKLFVSLAFYVVHRIHRCLFYVHFLIISFVVRKHKINIQRESAIIHAYINGQVILVRCCSFDKMKENRTNERTNERKKEKKGKEEKRKAARSEISSFTRLVLN